MRIEEFSHQYDLVASAYGLSGEQLHRRDEEQGPPLGRWLAYRGEQLTGVATARSRPDDRTFLRFGCSDTSGYGPLTEAAAALARPLYAIVDVEDQQQLAALSETGFVEELVMEDFLVPFDVALAALRRASLPSGFEIRRADAIDEDRLFTLDNTIRRDVPGTDGWRGDRAWFAKELKDAPPFDANTYLVAVDESNGEYAGLARVWRNADGPRFGLVGVTRRYRGTLVGPALIKGVLTAAAGWGYSNFRAGASTTNRVTYRALKRLGAETVGRSLQLVYRG